MCKVVEEDFVENFFLEVDVLSIELHLLMIAYK